MDHDTKLDGTERSVTDEIIEEFGEVEQAVGAALDDDLMEAEGTRKQVEHGNAEDAEGALEKHEEHTRE